MLAWLESEDGNAESTEEKCDETLMRFNGKVGIYVSADGAWQKRKIGKAGGDSTTGHNFACGGCRQKIVGLQSFSQHCRIHELEAKLGREPKPHRCPRNSPWISLPK